MYFAIQDIINFSESVEQQCGETSTKVYRYYEQEWEKNEAYLKKCVKTLAEEQSQENLGAYAQAIYLAATFMQDKKDRTISRLEYLSQHLFSLNEEAKYLLPRASLQFPKEIDKRQTEKHRQAIEDFKEKLSQSATITEKQNIQTKSVQSFLDSDEFKALKNYKILLTEDKRYYSFFCIDFRVKTKHMALEHLIETFEAQNTLEGIDTVMRTFYNTKGTSTEEKCSLYDFLNTAQNLFTWLFGIRTQTISLIDSLDSQLQTLLKRDNEEELVDLPLSHNM